MAKKNWEVFFMERSIALWVGSRFSSVSGFSGSEEGRSLSLNLLSLLASINGIVFYAGIRLHRHTSANTLSGLLLMYITKRKIMPIKSAAKAFYFDGIRKLENRSLIPS